VASPCRCSVLCRKFRKFVFRKCASLSHSICHGHDKSASTLARNVNTKVSRFSLSMFSLMQEVQEVCFQEMRFT
ncbi:unnamed protein product, partial [Larinioides sclopetarius]